MYVEILYTLSALLFKLSFSPRRRLNCQTMIIIHSWCVEIIMWHWFHLFLSSSQPRQFLLASYYVNHWYVSSSLLIINNCRLSEVAVNFSKKRSTRCKILYLTIIILLLLVHQSIVLSLSPDYHYHSIQHSSRAIDSEKEDDAIVRPQQEQSNIRHANLAIQLAPET